MALCSALEGSNFHHHPLESTSSIRLFRFISDEILPKASGPVTLKTISLEVQTFELHKAPEYRSLSYEWGKKELSQISLNGKQFQIRKNLWRFLAHAAYHFSNNWLWADQICIAQYDVDERSQQVGLMSQIYRQAKDVTVWLGDTSSTLYPALDHLTAEDYSLVEQATYWDRMWVVQEIMLAQHAQLMCANAIVPLWSPSCLKQYLYSITDRYWQSSRLYNMFLLYSCQPRMRRMSLSDALSACKDRFCVDPRDQIFAILSFVHPKQCVKVDYSISVEQVYWTALDKVLAKDGNAYLPWGGHIRFLDFIRPAWLSLHERMIGEQLDREVLNQYIRQFYRMRPWLRTIGSSYMLGRMLGRTRLGRWMKALVQEWRSRSPEYRASPEW